MHTLASVFHKDIDNALTERTVDVQNMRRVKTKELMHPQLKQSSTSMQPSPLLGSPTEFNGPDSQVSKHKVAA